MIVRIMAVITITTAIMAGKVIMVIISTATAIMAGKVMAVTATVAVMDAAITD